MTIFRYAIETVTAAAMEPQGFRLPSRVEECGRACERKNLVLLTVGRSLVLSKWKMMGASLCAVGSYGIDLGLEKKFCAGPLG